MARPVPLVASPLRYRQRVRDLDGDSVVMRLQWLPRLAGWYADVETPDGVVLATGRRINPGALSLIADRAQSGVPSGRFVTQGPTSYVSEQLGDTTQVVYVSADELAALVS